MTRQERNSRGKQPRSKSTHNVLLRGGAGGFGALHIKGTADFVAKNLLVSQEKPLPTVSGTHNVVILATGAGGAYSRNIEELR
jgi:hypothetical protein